MKLYYRNEEWAMDRDYEEVTLEQLNEYLKETYTENDCCVLSLKKATDNAMYYQKEYFLY